MWFTLYWLTKLINDKKACINVKNNDRECFKWSVKSALYPVDKDLQQVWKYKNWVQIDDALKDIQFSIEITSTEEFEKRTNISVNIYSYDADLKV